MPGTMPLARHRLRPDRVLARRAVVAVVLALLLLAPGDALAAKLLPLHPGQLTVLLGQSGEWQPQSGTALTLTLIAGPPRSRHAAALQAYVALQPSSRACAPSPAAAHRSILEMGAIYADATRVRAGSALAPDGGAGRDVHAASVGGIVVAHPGRAIRACTWLDSRPQQPARATAQEIPLLNGLFAASVWASSGPGGPPSAYTLDAQSVGRAFSFDVGSDFCGAMTTSHKGRVAASDEASYEVSISSIDCPGDGSTFTFSGPGGSLLGSIPYAIADADGSKVGHLGGCDLNGVAGLSLGDARRYVSAVGCRVARVLRAPYSRMIPRRGVIAAQVDGGIAPIAPTGTSVDLVVNG